MFRFVLLCIGGALALGIVALGVAVAAFRPRLWESNASVARNGGADPARIRHEIESFPPFRSVRNAAQLAQMEATVTAQLEELGWTVQAQLVERAPNPFLGAFVPPSFPRPPTHNLIATRGLATTGPINVVGAHLDSVSRSPGADDDGSGVAVLLELARILGPTAAARTELCFFNEEESGLFGSYTFVGRLSKEERSRIATAYILDMVGHFDSRPHSQAYPPPLSWLAPDQGNFLAAITLSGADAIPAMHRAHDRAAGDLPIVLFDPPRRLAASFRDIWRSDHAAFWHAQVPAVFLTDTGEFRSTRYHSASDTADAVDFDKVAQLTDMLADALAAPPESR
jgi:aminopeptidase YwaD